MVVIMKSNEFYYIKEVAKQCSFSKAAKVLGISQPALSNYIKKIEESMGVLLFDRSISPIEITEFGKTYLNYANEILQATDKMHDIMSDLQELKRGNLKLGSTACFSTGYLPGPISVFHQKYPGINFRIVEGEVSEVSDKCLTGDVDMYLTDGDIDDELFDKEKLFSERLIMAVPKSLPINEKIQDYRVPVEEIVEGHLSDSKYKSLNLKEMADQDFILLSENQHIRQMVNQMFKKAGFEPNIVMQVPQTTTGLAMSIVDVGVSFVAESTIKYNNLKEHPYYYKVGSDKETIRTMCIAYKKGKYISNAGQKFIEILKEQLG